MMSHSSSAGIHCCHYNLLTYRNQNFAFFKMVGSGVENNVKLCCRINKIPVLYCLLEIRAIIVLISLNYNEEFI